MTIAVGVLCQDGVLLCADTEHTGWTSKSHDSKLEDFEVKNGKVCFALSGNSSLAWSAIEKCKRHLHGQPSNNLLDNIEDILDKEYRRNVLSHPDYSNLDYQFLIALWRENDGIELYSTTMTALRRVRGFECIGIGAELASYLIRPGYNSPFLKDAVALTAYVLACVKENISGCGGMSVYRMIRKDGEIGTLTNIHDGPCRDVEEYARVHDFSVRRLLLWMADTQTEDKHFEQNVTEVFLKELFSQRREWSRMRKNREKELADRNPHLTPAQIRAVFNDWSMGFAPKSPKTSKPKKR